MHKIRILAVCILLNALAVFLTACSSGKVPGEDDSESGGSGGVMLCNGCPCVGDLDVGKPQSLGNPNICAIGGTLTQNAILPRLATDEWHITGSITVDSGILTVQAGAEIFAEQDEYIYVMPGGAIRSIGTASSPVIFSSVDDGYDLDTSLGSTDGWIGLVIDTGMVNDANRLEYTIVAEAGLEAAFVGAGHQAGITLLGSQANTVFSNVQVHDTFGDGIHIDGQGSNGAAKLDSILVTGAGRDGIHYDDFSGLIKDVLVIHSSDVYSAISNRGGRAGIRAGGINSNPLITSLTLAGRDALSTNDPGDEYGFLIQNNSDEIRIANSLILNFRHGCYAIEDGADLSLVTASGGPLDGFVGGVHCVDETAGNADIGDPSPLANDLPDTGNGNGPGLRFYDGSSANFEKDTNAAAGFTEGWRLNSIGALMNGGNSDTCANEIASHLCLYNDGVTDPDQFLGVEEGLTEPGTIYFYVGPVPIVDWNPLDGVTFDDYVFIDPLTQLPLDPQPPATNNFVSGYITEIQSSGAFDLTQIGAVKDASLNLFDVWTLQGGAVSPAVTGFDP